MEERNYKNSSLGFCGALTVAFIVLKLCGVIEWSWIWVLAPLWIPIAIVGVIFLIMIIVIAISDHLY